MASGHVIVLDLGGQYYLQSNGLDPAIFNLTLLRNLSLSGNDFRGAQLPSSGFERLSELVSLDLSLTNFAGQIPAGIASLNKLLTLDLSGNPNLFLSKPNFQSFIANLSRLKELYLDEMDLSSNGPTWSTTIWPSISQIQTLSLMSCGLSGPIAPSFSRLRFLTMVNLRGNFGITGVVPEFFANFSLLTILDLSGNDFEGQFPTRIFQLKRLRFLDLHWNDNLCVQLPEFQRGNQLVVLDLVMTKINCSSVIPASLVNLKSLKHLGLSTSRISRASDISVIGKIQSLEELRLYEMSGPRKPEFSWSWIGGLKNVTYLELNSYDLSGALPSSITNLTNLNSLTLHSCNISRSIPLWIGNLTKLSNLNLGSNSLTGKILACI
jgi:Leucine-rich repeat (LRR) protein